MILQDHMIKGSCGVMGKSSSYHPAKFGGHKQSGSRDIMVFVCHLIFEDHVIKTYDFMVRSPSQ